MDGISAIVMDQNKDNESYIDAAPGVSPHQIFRILPDDLSVYLQHHQEHLEYKLIIKDIENIGLQHKSL